MHATATEEKLYSLRADQSENPFALLINDSKNITIETDFHNRENPYTVKGSPASQQLFDLEKTQYAYAKKLSQLVARINALDSLPPSDSASQRIYDSTRNLRMSEYEATADDMKNYVYRRH